MIDHALFALPNEVVAGLLILLGALPLFAVTAWALRRSSDKLDRQIDGFLSKPQHHEFVWIDDEGHGMPAVVAIPVSDEDIPPFVVTSPVDEVLMALAEQNEPDASCLSAPPRTPLVPRRRGHHA